MPSSFTPPLPSNIVLDSGIIYCDRDTPFDPLTPEDESMMVKWGATRGGVNFNENAEWRNVPFDGASGENEGLHRKTDGVPTLTATTILLSPENLLMLSPGATQAYDGEGDAAKLIVTPLPYRTMLVPTDYHRFRAVWKRGNGGTFGILFPRAIATMDSFGAQDNNEGEIPITIKAVNAQADIIDTDEVIAPFVFEYTGPDVAAGSYYGTY
jgi:hypothetical protein